METKRKKKLGILGGMGPKATSHFLDQLVERTSAKLDSDHIDMVIINHASLPPRPQAIETKHPDNLLAALKKDISVLEFAEVDMIALPCNTAHYYYDKMQSMTTLPILNMVELTANKASNITKSVSILGTTATVENNIYDPYLEQYGVANIKLDQDSVAHINTIISEIKQNNYSNVSKYLTIVKALLGLGITPIIACSELSCIDLQLSLKRRVIDSIDVLVEQVIISSGATLRKKR